jgi:gliding motility-associated lipoprotein GldD
MSNEEQWKQCRLFISLLLFLVFCSLFVLLVACSEPSPKPLSYFRIDIPQPNYQVENKFKNFTFELSDQAMIKESPQNEAGEFFNIVYNQLQAEIYCSYIPIKKEKLAQFSEESRKFVYLHAVKADAIQEHFFENPQQKVYGIVYNIKGNVASSTQFVLTDSVSAFFRGALYFYNRPNFDSIAPVLEYINKDIQVIIESFRWKK